MTWLRRIFQWRISADWLDVRVGQFVCFAMTPLFLLIAWSALAKYVATPGEAILSILASLAVAMQFIVIGMLMPLTEQAKQKS